MSLLFIDSFDHYATLDLSEKWTQVFPALGAVEIVPNGVCEGNCVKFDTIESISKGVTCGGTPNVGTAGFHMKVAYNLYGFPFFGVTRIGMASNFQFYVFLDATSGAIIVYDGDGVMQTWSPPDSIRTNEWVFFECQWAISPVAGTIILHVNGVEVLNVGGLDLQYSLHPDNLWHAVKLACVGNACWYADNFYVLDDAGAGPDNTFLGDSRVQAIYPEGVGANLAWTPVGAAANWDCVDDDDVLAVTAAPDGDTTYVEANAAGTRDTHVFTDIDLVAGTIFGVQALINCEKIDTGARLVAAVIRHGGIDNVGANRAPSYLSYNYMIQIFPLNPGTAAVWTIADVNNAEYGYQLTV